MGSRPFPFIASVVAVLVLIVSRPVAAQVAEPVTVGLGYQFLHVSFDVAGETFPIGAYADIARVVKSDDKKAWGWIGQFEAGFRRGDGFSEQLLTFLGGVRLASTKPLKWTPSGHGLIGFGSLNTSCDLFCAGAERGVAFQAGIAVSTRIDDRKSASIGFKATKLKVQSGGLFNMAVSLGIQVALGATNP